MTLTGLALLALLLVAVYGAGLAINALAEAIVGAAIITYRAALR